MADSLCGPSNALQNFQKHTGADRTLQQDRLVGRPSASEGFRSSPGPHVAAAERDFEAFQNGQPPMLHPEPHAFGPHPGAFPSAQQPMHSAASTWTSDFQRMNISSPPPMQMQQFSQGMQRQNVGMSAWGTDFAQQKQTAGPTFAQSSLSPAQPGFMAPNFHMPNGAFASPQMQAPVAAAPDFGSFDEEAFAKAFEAAEQAELAYATMSDAKSDVVDAAATQEETVQSSHEDDAGQHEPLYQQERIGADLIHDPSQIQDKNDENREQQEDPDALARTAANLLDRLRDNETPKFQNSQFLSLMRQLRDKELVVQGDKFVASLDANSGHSEIYPEDSMTSGRGRLENQPADSTATPPALSSS